MRYCHAQSRHDSGVGACLVESGLYHSILVHLLGLVYIFSPYLASFLSRFHFSMLLLSFFRSLVRVASRGSPFFFRARVAVFSMWPVLRGGLVALCLLVSQHSVWSRGALLRRLDQRRCECNSNLFQGKSSIPVPTSTASPRSRHRGTLLFPSH